MAENYRNKNSMVLTQKQTHRSMEQNRKLRNKAIDCDQLLIDYDKGGEKTTGEKTVSSISDAVKLDSFMYKKEIRTFPHTI